MSVVQPPGCLPAKVSFISSSSFPFRIFSGDLFSFSPIINSFVLSFGICSLSFFQSRPVVVSTFMDLSSSTVCVCVRRTVHREAISSTHRTVWVFVVVSILEFLHAAAVDDFL